MFKIFNEKFLLHALSKLLIGASPMLLSSILILINLKVVVYNAFVNCSHPKFPILFLDKSISFANLFIVPSNLSAPFSVILFPDNL